jgi:hypothetical protein
LKQGSKMTVRQREPRQENAQYLAHVRTLGCLICGAKAEPAHIRMGCIEASKNPTGGGEKSSDKWALPVCREHHDEQHDAGSEILFWRKYKLDPFAIAMRLWTAWRAAHGADEPETKRYRTRKRSSFKVIPTPQHFVHVKHNWPKRPFKSRGFGK